MKGIEDIYPLSPMQQGMLFHSLYSPHVGAYIEQIPCRIEGHLDAVCFRESWRKVLARHPILRTAFLWEGLDEPVQVVRPELEVVGEFEDWRGLSTPEQQARLARFLERDRRNGFELARAPLTRYLLAQTGATSHEFVWTFHHLILDGWSIPLVLRDFFQTYRATCRGEQVDLPDPRPFRDYIEWLQQQEQPAAMEFWRRTLGGFSAPTKLAVDTRVGEFRDQAEAVYNEARFRITAQTTARLQSFTHQHQITMNTLVLGAWALLLSRYSGQTDVVVGATVSGRAPQLVGADQRVGMFVNTLPVRARIDPEASVAAWLQSLQAQLVAARQYEYSSLVQVHGWSDVPRGLPLFESILSFQNQPISQLLHGVDCGLRVDLHVVYHTRTTYPLTIIAGPGAELSLIVVYDTRRFEAATIARLINHLETLLTSVASGAERAISGLSILGEAEQRLLQEFNRTCASPPESLPCLHQLFERQAAAAPDRVAVIAGAQSLAYGELNARANQLAHYLRGLGVGPEVIVGLCVERSVEMVVGMLGVLKAGGAYLPLDPKYPLQRLAHMLEDSAATVLLTQHELQSRLDFGARKVVCIDADWTEISACSGENPAASASPDNLMYVIYTSGSTGTPKGSLLTYANAASLFEAAGAGYGFSESDVWTLFHSYAFDFSVWEIWGALRHGGRLVVVPEEIIQSPRELYDLLRVQGVTVLNVTPSVFLPLLDFALEMSKPASLRWIIFGGEALDLASLKPWFQRFGFDAPRLVNMYGITETTVHVTYRPITAADYPSRISSPIGVPLEHLQTYILDAQLRPVPVNVPGELYIGGTGLARGYLNRPGLTAERFLPNPFDARSGGRLYRTGDGARFVGNLEIEYLGRLDEQMKIRGFRVEAGEIEAVIRRHEQVRDVAVVSYEETSGDKRLAAHIVLHDNGSVTASQFRRYLSSHLPTHMIPSRFLFREAFPLMPTGKIDKRALPVPRVERPELDEEYVAPRNELEEQLANIWSEVLGTQRVGVYDDFFELGGHSLLATRLFSRVRDAFEVDLPLRSLFEFSTIDSLAIAILHRRTEQASPAAMAEIFAEIECLVTETTQVRLDHGDAPVTAGAESALASQGLR